MKDVRREEHILTSMHMVTYMKTHHKQWLDQHKATKKDPYKAILGISARPSPVDTDFPSGSSVCCGWKTLLSILPLKSVSR
ncbi:hypothetical protein H257_02882 [Aphanomyces astaci]|uniref:Uncharacterized protein n=1 Tax=Aphanomyces astaci TaxID=112090 RepID=W4H152_APHAT|nr:hypothetical protein H257_02882 [Aphanomyces astaci]ETV84989.1 hypothetical protein H257_02882 [Aphanomyces astaci]|eukprot:XP_009825007.1 hypothetical protein H257_02882 [Aphanomyces astaci]